MAIAPTVLLMLLFLNLFFTFYFYQRIVKLTDGPVMSFVALSDLSNPPTQFTEVSTQSNLYVLYSKKFSQEDSEHMSIIYLNRISHFSFIYVGSDALHDLLIYISPFCRL